MARFVAFHEAPGVPNGAAPTFAVVLARGPSGVVLVFNRFRQVWELPGGLIDPGESPQDSARRELAEEAGCRVDAIDWLGLVEVSDAGHRWGAVYGCLVSHVPARMSNEEVDGIAAWTPDSSPQPLGPTDRALLESLYDRTTRAGPPQSR